MFGLMDFRARRAIFFPGWNLVVVFVLLEEIGDVEERVPLEAEVDKGGLHTGKNPCNPAFMYAASQ
jgi:hypothetical protein